MKPFMMFLPAVLSFIAAASLMTPMQEARAVECPIAAWAESIRTVVLPSWESATPESVVESWPGGLRRTGWGSSEAWQQDRDNCTVRFVFAPREKSPGFRLHGLQVTEWGDRRQLRAHAAILATSVGSTLTSQERRDLDAGALVRTIWRMPANTSVEGVIRHRVISVVRPNRRSKDKRWVLEFAYDDFPDKPHIPRKYPALRRGPRTDDNG
jgi:hypothetical protein